MLKAVGLPTAYRPGLWPELREAMAVDKKARGARLRMVVLDGLAQPAMLDAPPEDLLGRAYQEVCRPMKQVLVLNGPNLAQLGSARAGRVRHRRRSRTWSRRAG